jgi:hypothetical protein
VQRVKFRPGFRSPVPTLCLAAGCARLASIPAAIGSPPRRASRLFSEIFLARARVRQVELQGVALVVLSFFRDEAAARALADTVAAHGGVLGAAVCCAENGGDPADEWTTCDRDRDQLLDRCVGFRV